MANDGDPSTGWEPANAAPGAWWQVDLEEAPAIQSVEVDFANDGACQYKIEGSNDGATWTFLANETKSTSTARIRKDRCPGNSQYRYVRLTITGSQTSNVLVIDEVKIFGRSVR